MVMDTILWQQPWYGVTWCAHAAPQSNDLTHDGHSCTLKVVTGGSLQPLDTLVPLSTQRWHLFTALARSELSPTPSNAAGDRKQGRHVAGANTPPA
jgi:hypothetical protein